MKCESRGKVYKNYKYYQISQIIIDKIATGQWKVGEKIPPEAELCQLLNVSRVTLRESLKTLAILGILDIVQGDGTYVNEISPASFIEPLLPLLRCNAARIEEVYTSRIIVESGCCSLAAENATEDDVACLGRLIEEMRQAAEDGQQERYSVADHQFHQKIIQISGNQLLEAVCNMFSELATYYTGKINEAPEAISSSLGDHVKIFEAVRNHRSEYARVMMSEHLRTSLLYLLKRQSDAEHST